MSRFKSWRSLSRDSWGREYNPGETVSREELQIGAVLRIADAVEKAVFSLNLIIQKLGELEKAVNPAKQAERAKAAAKAEKDRRAKESLARAEAAFRGVRVADVPALSSPVENLKWSVRARKCLRREGITTLGELCSRTEDQLLEIRNFGMTSLVEIKDRLAELGLTLASAEAEK